MRRLRRMEDVPEVDLTAEVSVTTALLNHPLAWRVRAVEHLTIESSTSCRRRRSLQCAPLRPLVPQGLITDADAHALVVLNIASVPRGALLDLDFEGADGNPCFLLPRGEIAARESAYLLGLADELEVTLRDGPRALLRAALAFTEHPAWVFHSAEDLRRGVADYLADGLNAPVPDDILSSWIELDRRAAKLVAPYAAGNHGLSPTEHPLLAVPLVLRDLPGDGGLPALGLALEGYVDLLEEAAERAGPPERPTAANDLLSALADYGRNYDMLVATAVPLDRPFVLKYGERRTVALEGGSGVQDVVINDAGSNHVVVAIEDPNVVLVETELRSTDGDSAYGHFAVRKDPQTYAVYTHGEDRDYRAILHVKLAPLTRQQVAAYVVAVFLVCISAALAYEHPRRLADLALVAGPSALAAGVVLTRETTTLSTHLRRGSSRAVLVSLLVLLAVATGSYVTPLAVRALRSWC